ncbi:hypothetical protein VNO78_18307 [Psophocarpus tetragonolobus]|uniref:Uncharacterized protein n=1 Tax=Psophocarpus tetragonolobus TaxID=3891 RepID=A0AAN9XLQ6_PSOTE
MNVGDVGIGIIWLMILVMECGGGLLVCRLEKFKEDDREVKGREGFWGLNGGHICWLASIRFSCEPSLLLQRHSIELYHFHHSQGKTLVTWLPNIRQLHNWHQNPRAQSLLQIFNATAVPFDLSLADGGVWLPTDTVAAHDHHLLLSNGGSHTVSAHYMFSFRFGLQKLLNKGLKGDGDSYGDLGLVGFPSLTSRHYLRSCASKRSHVHLWELPRRHIPDVVSVMETQVQFDSTKKFWEKEGYQIIMLDEALGHPGWIWCLWEELWMHLEGIKGPLNEPWLVTGNYNNILLPSEYQGGVFSHSRASKFSGGIDQ